MFGIKTFLAGLTLGGVTSLLAMQFHVINTNDGLIVLPRANRPPIRSTYVDVRKWSLSMWKQHPEVAQAAVKYGRPDLLGSGALNSIFPQQAGFQAEPTANPKNEKPKFALDALVPIKFSNPNGSVSVVEPKVPDPIFPFAKTPPEIPQEGFQPALNHQEHNHQGQRGEPVLPENSRVNSGSFSGLPKLQNPVPIFDEMITRNQNQRSQQQYNPQPKSGLFTDVLRALVPQNEQASAHSNRQHNAARPNFGVQAPNPNQRQNVNPGRSFPSQEQNFAPTVRPF